MKKFISILTIICTCQISFSQNIELDKGNSSLIVSNEIMDSIVINKEKTIIYMDTIERIKIGNVEYDITNKGLHVVIDGDKISVSRNYNGSNHDTFTLVLDKPSNCVNPIICFSKLIYKKGTIEETSVVGTDYVGPWVINAVNNADGDMHSTSGFSGGWHGSTGNQTGTPTGRTSSFKVFIDNKIREDGDYICNKCQIEVVNKIQARNTIKDDGSGREVLTEKVTYTFEDDKVYVEMLATANEDILIKKYYGMQVPVFVDNIKFVGENYVDVTVAAGTWTSATLLFTTSDNIREVRSVRPNSSHAIIAAMDNICLGTYNKALGNNKVFATNNGNGQSAYTKIYYYLIGETTSGIALNQNDSIMWRGYYRFFDVSQ